MGSLSPHHWLIVAVIAVTLLGGGRFSAMMRDVAKGLRDFRRTLSEEKSVDPQNAADLPDPQQREH